MANHNHTWWYNTGPLKSQLCRTSFRFNAMPGSFLTNQSISSLIGSRGLNVACQSQVHAAELRLISGDVYVVQTLEKEIVMSLCRT